MTRPRRAVLFDLERLGQFASVGILGATIDIAISGALVLYWDLLPELAKLIGAECAIVVMFLVNDRWTFSGSGAGGCRAKVHRLVKSNLVRSGGIGVQLVVVFVLTRISYSVYVGATDIWPVLTMPIAIGCGFLVNYIGETLFTWRAYR